MNNYIYKDNLESERLITRKLVEFDIETWADFFREEEAVKYIPSYGLATAEERSKHWIDRQLGRYADNKFGHLALIDKKTNQFVGQCGLLIQDVNGNTEIEVGYHIFKKYWGRGYAPEAARMMINYAFDNHVTDYIISMIDVNNIRSQRVAEKNGLVRGPQTRWNDFDIFIYRMDKKDWK